MDIIRQKLRKQGRFDAMLDFVRKNSASRRMLRHVDWPLVALVIAVSLYGIVSIFAATCAPVTDESLSFLQKVGAQSMYYPRLQFIWLLAGLVVMAAAAFFDYDIYYRLSSVVYWANVALLFIVLGAGPGRGGMSGWFGWGNDRTFQPSEVGKIAIIISLAKLFATRKKPIRTFAELLPVLAHVGLPLVLIVLQPDVGTALVYIVIFAGMLFVSKTDYKLLIGIVCVMILLMIPLWYVMNVSDSFRFARIQVFLNPDYDPNGWGMQTTNARIAVGRGGLFGLGFFAPGSFASLNYIPDDHTDFIFAIVCETFGYVGAGAMVLLFVLLLWRLYVLARRAQDAFGSYLVFGVLLMMLFHIFENVSMVIGLMPVTGIPLPFVSYGGSNFLSNMMGIGMALSVAMRSRTRSGRVNRRESSIAKL